MMIFSLVAMTGLEKCCITSAYLQWLCHSGERPVARGPLVLYPATIVLRDIMVARCLSVFHPSVVHLSIHPYFRFRTIT